MADFWGLISSQKVNRLACGYSLGKRRSRDKKVARAVAANTGIERTTTLPLMPSTVGGAADKAACLVG